jgi:AmpE protein
MIFIVTLIGLLLERFFNWSHLRQWKWYAAYQEIVLQRLPGKSSYLVLFLTLLPLVLALWCVEWILNGCLYGVATLVFELIIFIYCLGPKNLWAETFAAAAGAGNQLFIDANRRVFAVLFWYMLLGPFGALLYRLLNLSVEKQASAAFFVSVLDWLPARIFTFLLGLGGHFPKAFACWRTQVLKGPETNDALLTSCGIAALSLEEGHKPAEQSVITKSAVNLVDRAFVMALVLVALAALLS